MLSERWMWIFFAGGLLALSLTDLEERKIPNGVLAALVLNRAVWLFLLRQPAAESIRGMVPGLCLAGALLGTVWAAERVWKQKIMGGGDQKLVIVLALYLEWTELLLTLFLGCLLGVLGKRSGFHRKKGRAVPLGPFLSVGAVLTLCFGQPMIRWYLGFLA